MAIKGGAWILSTVFLFPGCASLMPAHPQSNMRRNERVVIETEWWSGEKSSGAQGSTSIAGLITLGTEKLASLFVEAIEKEAELHTAEYTARLSATGFYDTIEDESPDLKSITVRRFIDVQGETIEAFHAKLLVVGAAEGNGAFQLVPLEGHLAYSKAKVADTRWYLPWTWFGTSDGKIDVDVQVVIDACWVTQDLKFHRETIGDVTIPMRRMHFGRTWRAERSGTGSSAETGTTGEADTPLNPDPIDGKGEDVKRRKARIAEVAKRAEESAGYPRSDFFPLVPRSKYPLANEGEGIGNGMFTLRIRVREFDDYGDQVSRFAEAAGARKDALLDKAKEALDRSLEPRQGKP